MPFKRSRNIDIALWLLMIAGAVSALWLQLHYHKFMEVDTVSYINIGELYAAGKWGKAINGYWSPLYSWMIAAALKAGIRPHMTCYFLNDAAALLCFYFLRPYAARVFPRLLFYILFLVSMIVLLTFFALSEETPDLLSLSFTFWFLSILSKNDFFKSRYLPYYAGVVGAVMYLTKSYNSIFVNLFLLVLAALAIILPAKHKQERFRAYGITWISFLAVSLLWIIPLSIHEGKPAFSTAGTYSHNYVGPSHPGHPIVTGIVPPSNEEAYTGWLNPAHLLDASSWAVFDSRRNTLHQLGLIAVNAKVMVKIINTWKIRFDLLLILMLLLFCYSRQIGKDTFWEISPWLLIMFIYPLGYLPFFMEGRYIYLDASLLLLTIFYMLQQIMTTLPFLVKKPVYAGVLSVTFTAFLLTVQINAFAKQKALIYAFSQRLWESQEQLTFLSGKRIVTDKPNYILGTQLCYTSQSRLYGVWSPEQIAKASALKVEYLITGTPVTAPGTDLVKAIPSADGETLVYKLPIQNR